MPPCAGEGATTSYFLREAQAIEQGMLGKRLGEPKACGKLGLIFSTEMKE